MPANASFTIPWPRVLRAALLVVLSAFLRPAPAGAGCGCDKPPPALAAIRPAFASPGNEVTLFPPGVTEGASYTVAFAGTPGTSVETTAIVRRDFADGIEKPQLVLAAPALPPGPTAVTVTQGGVTVLSVPAEQFIMLQPAIRLAERSGKTIATCYRAAVGSDGTVYFPLSISGIAERMLFKGAARGWRFTYDAADLAIYNTQGVLMQLLGPDQASIFSIVDDQAAIGGVQTTDGDGGITVDFDGSPSADLALFQPLPTLDQFEPRNDGGIGNPRTGGIRFNSDHWDGLQFAVFDDKAGRFAAPGARVVVGVDVKFDTPPIGWGGVGLLGMGQGLFFGLQPESSGSVLRAVVTTSENASLGSQVAAGDAIAPSDHWLRVRATFEVDGSDLTVDGTVLDLGTNGTDLPGTPVLSLHTTLSNDALEQSPAVLGGFGAVGINGGPKKDPYFDNFFVLVQKGDDGGSGSSDEPEGEGVDQHVRSFRLSYDRHEFLTYQARHVTNPDFFPDHDDRHWHTDGTRHIDHGNLVISIRGRVNDAAPTPGQSPRFDFHVTTTPADDPSAPAGTPVVVAGDCGDTTPPPPETPGICGAQPATGCLAPARPARSRLNLRKRARKGRDQLVWSWTAKANMPEATDALQGDVALCMYDESGAGPARLLRTAVAGEVSCRRRRSGVSCHRRGSEPNALSVDLRVERNKRISLVAAAQGKDVGMPTMPLPVPMRVQLQTTGGVCWEAVYSATDTGKNAARRFNAHN